MTLPLRARLALITTIVFGVLLLALTLLSYQLLAQQLDADVTVRLAELTDGLEGYLRFDSGAVSVQFDPSDNDQTTFVSEATRYYQVFDATTGEPLAASRGIGPLGLNLTPAEVRAYSADPTSFDITTGYGRLRIANRVRTLDGRTYLLQVGASLGPMDAALAHYRSLLLWTVPGALLLASALAWWLSSYALLPLSRMTAAARAIDVTSLERRLPLRGVDDELDRVAGAFNGTLDRLERAVGEMRQFGSALAHELRTPLTALRGAIELAMRRPEASDAQRRGWADQIEEIDRLTRLSDHILTLARAEAGQIRLTFDPVDLGAMAATLVEQLEPVADARSQTLRCEGAGGIVVSGDAGWLRRLFLNLIGNAIKYTNRGGAIVVRVSRAGETVRVDVEDTGIGLSPEDAAHVFEPFFRADKARSSSNEGAGLGLSLVAWIAGQHHGTVSVESRLGDGSTFTVSLPAGSPTTPPA
jgi:heavy metal sensor kinase